jgi:hypothetical protein
LYGNQPEEKGWLWTGKRQFPETVKRRILGSPERPEMDKSKSNDSFKTKLRKASLKSLNELSDHPGGEAPRVELSNPILDDIRDSVLHIREPSEETQTENQSRADRLLRAALKSIKESFVLPDRG